MMLVQKPQPLSLAHRHSHRRQSSAPVVVVAVKPTQVPGLLSLSKPAPSPTTPTSPRRPNTRAQLKNSSSTKQQTTTTIPTPALSDTPFVVRAQASTPVAAADIPTRTVMMDVSAPATPSPQSRGRSEPKHLTKRSKIQPSSSPLKRGLRQPSPNLSPSSQAEAPVQIDPFSDSPATKAIPVHLTRFNISTPSNNNNHVNKVSALARSELLPLPMAPYPQERPRPIPSSKPFVGMPMALDFPVCDDMSEIAGDDHDCMDVDASNDSFSRPMPISLPVTPSRPSNQSHNQPQQKRNRSKKASSVPPSSPPRHSHPSSNTHTPPKNPRKQAHRRTPSESDGVFHMSSDEDHSISLFLGPNAKSTVPALFAFPVPSGSGAFRAVSNPTTTTSTPFGTPPKVNAIHPGNMAMSTSLDKANFFASSMFQNSPSPDELPDPLLL